MDEQRNHPRTATSLATIYYKVPDESDNEFGRMHYPGTITDTSQTGVGMIVSYPHQPSEKLWLEGLENKNGAVPCIVQWIKGIEDRYTMGMKFIKDSD